MPVTGDNRKLQRLVDRMRQVGSAEFQRSCRRNIAEEARRLIVEGFAAGKSPEGEAWAPLKTRQGQPLRDTNRLQNSLIPRASATGFIVSSPVRYANVHQHGAVIKAKAGGYLVFKTGAGWASKREVRIPRRQFLPEKRLSVSWALAFTRVLGHMLEQRVARGA